MKTNLNECINAKTYEVDWDKTDEFLKEAKEIYKKAMKLAKEEFDFELEDECERLKESYKKVKENMRYKKRNEEYKIDKGDMFRIINLLFCECTLCDLTVWKHERDNKFKEINRRHEEIDEKNEMIKEIKKIYEKNKEVSNMCICKEIKIDEKILISKGDWVDLFLDKDEYGYYIMGMGDGNAYMKIKYCPLCGRLLEEED